MKIILALMTSMLLCTGLASANSKEIDRGLETMALLHILNDPALQAEIAADVGPRGLGDLIDSIKANVGGLIESFLTTFDLNGNGRIDRGEETENLKQTINDVALLLVDADKNGAIEPQEISALVQQLVQQVQGQIEETVCNKIILDAQKLGDFINFNPLLKAAYNRCTKMSFVD